MRASGFPCYTIREMMRHNKLEEFLALLCPHHEIRGVLFSKLAAEI